MSATATAPAVTGTRPNGTNPATFSPQAEAQAKLFLAALHPLAAFRRDSESLLAKLPTQKRDKNHFGPGGESVMAYYRGTVKSAKDKSQFLDAKFSGADVFGAAVSIALDAINGIMTRMEDPEDESLRQETLKYLKAKDERFKPSFFIETISQASKVHSAFKRVEKDATYLNGQWNTIAKALGVEFAKMTYDQYYAKIMAGGGTESVETTPESTGDIDSLASAF